VYQAYEMKEKGVEKEKKEKEKKDG